MTKKHKRKKVLSEEAKEHAGKMARIGNVVLRPPGSPVRERLWDGYTEWGTCSKGHYAQIQYKCHNLFFCSEHRHGGVCCEPLDYDDAKAIRENQLDAVPVEEKEEGPKPKRLKKGVGILCFEGAASTIKGDHHIGAKYVCSDWGDQKRFFCEEHRDKRKCCRRIRKKERKWAQKESWESYMPPYSDSYRKSLCGEDYGETTFKNGEFEEFGDEKKLPVVKFAKEGR